MLIVSSVIIWIIARIFYGLSHFFKECDQAYDQDRSERRAAENKKREEERKQQRAIDQLEAEVRQLRIKLELEKQTKELKTE